MPKGPHARSARSREAAELEELKRRVIDEAPPEGTNELLDELHQAQMMQAQGRAGGLKNADRGGKGETSVNQGPKGAVGDGAPVVKRARRFSELPLSQKTIQGLQRGKWERMTDIQRAAIPHALAGRDVLGAAKTGSGKTLSFLVPMLEALYRQHWCRMSGLGAVVISPTRELALQIFDVLRVVGQKHDLSAGLVIGGKDAAEEAERIGGMNILIATPGRLLQHLDQAATFDCLSLQVLVLDEADRLLDLGFQSTMEAILAALPKQRQTFLFSATQTRKVKDLARLSLKNPQYIAVHETAKSATPTKLVHHYMTVPLGQKLDVLWAFIRTHLQQKCLVFLSSCKQVKLVHSAFSAMQPGVPLLCLHGRQKQMKRLAIYTEFCQKKRAVLFATDIAARGLDFPAVNWVVQLDCPEDVATYIHRTGRTARHTASGRALLMLLPSESKMIEIVTASKIELQRLRPNRDKLHSLQGKMRSLLSQRPELKYIAQRAFVAYVRSIKLQANKEVFDVHALPLQEFAESLGLPAAPRVRGLNKSGESKNWKAGNESDESGDESDESGDEGGGEHAKRKAGGASDDDDDGTDDDDEGGDDDDEYVLRPKERKKSARNKLTRLLDRHTAERLAKSTGATKARPAQRVPGEARPVLGDGDDDGDGDGDGDILKVKRRITPDDPDDEQSKGGEEAAEARKARKAQKIKIRKGGTVEGAKRTVFDEDGAPITDKFGDTFEDVVAEKEASTTADPDRRVEEVRAQLRAHAQRDRERERQRVRQKHIDQKRKRKERSGDILSNAAENVVLLGGEGDDVASDATDDAPPARTKRGKSTHKHVETHKHADADVAPAASLHADERRAEEMLAKLLHS